jgi:hypothetical protein
MEPDMQTLRSGYLPPVVFLICCCTVPAIAAPRVELELITEPGFPMTESHRWLRMLKDLDVGNLRIRSAGPREKVEIRQRGSGNSTVYHVTGLLTTRNTLRLPGGEFRHGDKPGIAAWIAKLKEGGASGLHEKPGPFGLTATQLVAVHEALSSPVTFSTKGQKSYDAMKKIADGLSLSFTADHGAVRVMAGDKPVLDELQGLSAGTALAAILRPLGLALVPQKSSGGEIKLFITQVQRAPESWPVGWPSEKSPNETLPELFKFLPVEIEDQPLAEVFGIIGSRIKAPILYDHNSLARHGIKPAEVKVSQPRMRTYYQGIINRLAHQAKLKSDLRVDEAGKPFLWISSLQR